MPTTHLRLKHLAATTWYIGGIMLSLKAFSLLSEAYQLAPESTLIGWSLAIGGLAGLIKAKYLFSKSCQRNLQRIDQLQAPKLWQFFRPHFFLFLALMITAGALLSQFAHGDFNRLIVVATIDISLATALIRSGRLFWKIEATKREND